MPCSEALPQAQLQMLKLHPAAKAPEERATLLRAAQLQK